MTGSKNMPKISIIIPVYNVQSFLPKALDSVINQTLHDFEAICVDDCSTDDCLLILREYAGKDPRIKVIESEKNGGPGAARNLALDIASGEYIMFLDPDDWFEPYACEEAYNQISRNNCDVAFFDYYTYSESYAKILINKVRSTSKFSKVENKDCFKLYELNKLNFTSAAVWCQIYKRSFLEKINARFSETKTCEDNPFYFYVLSNAENVTVIEQFLYFYRLRNSGTPPSYMKYHEHVGENKALAYELIKKSRYSEKFQIWFIPYYWKSAVFGHYHRVIKFHPEYKDEILEKINDLAVKINSCCNVNQYENDFDLWTFDLYLHCKTKRQLKIRKFFKKIYSAYNKDGRKIIRICGIKIKVKRKRGSLL